MPQAFRRAVSDTAHRARPGRSTKTAEKSAGIQPLEQRILLTATLCLLALGAVMVYSASSPRSLLEGRGNGTGQLIKFLICGALGLGAMRLLSRGGLKLARAATAPLLICSCLLVLAVHIPHIGIQINGARRWIGPSVLQFQPSELLKIALVLYCAELLARRPGRVRTIGDLYNPLLIVTGIACLLVASQPDLGTAMVIAFTISALLIAAGMPLRTFALIAGVALGLLVLYAIVQPYSRARLTSFIDPWSHAGTSGFQSVQGQIAIGSGGLFGVGPGQSVQKAFYLPEAQTDFILAVIGEELGAFGVCALLFLYGLIAYAGLRTAKAARSLYSSLVAVGVTSLILSQALLNMFAVLGLAPLTGVPLPLVSYGASSMVVMLISIGLLLDIAGGAGAHLRAVRSSPARRATTVRRSGSPGSGGVPARGGRRLDAGKVNEDRDRGRRHGGTRGPGAGGRRRAAG